MAEKDDAAGPYVAPIRLHVSAELGLGRVVPLSSDQHHYLHHVMRCKPGDRVALFNGHDGEWLATVAQLGKKGGDLEVQTRTRPQVPGPDLWLVFAPVKRARLDYMVQKAVELGVSAIHPVLTRFTSVDRVKESRLGANAREAAEQCGRLDLPAIGEPVSLNRLLDEWDPARRLVFCDEGGDARPLAVILGEAARPPGPWAVLIGPEGGFHPAERERLRDLPFVVPATLGPRILRSDTAAVVALALWQATLGDWGTPDA